MILDKQHQPAFQQGKKADMLTLHQLAKTYRIDMASLAQHLPFKE
ncbi:hypothetical protein [Glaesserella parasuis]|nr:hypothetical protein [Glaesserella parasuis]MDE3954690.1 hypothetical protein [Glaesserella parasuis]MDG6247188.1 hypothetical protein [Glaesserella parasuis]MDG6254693.1 hypothetical protein [Glaesserella parasuis]MDG6266900.1 hypothetical protein [Glaesserella parasuis]MDG6279366.1 hypothetical protein [Glaesserella parasuis]